jgi:CHAD domain-containing protein
MKTNPLEIGPEEAPGAGIRRIAGEQMDKVCSVLRKGGDPVDAVHEARKSLKKLRAAFRFVAPKFGNRRRQAEKAALQAAARLLGPTRDAEVRLATLTKLTQTAPAKGPDFAAIRVTLEANRDKINAGAAITKRRVLAHLDAARGRLQSWPLQSLTFADLRTVIRHTYREGRRALATYHHHPSPEAFHAWRKRVKELWYQLRMLRHAFSRAKVDRRIKRLDQVGIAAGEAHDFDALRADLKHHPSLWVQAGPVIAEIDACAPDFYREALKKGGKFYRAKPAEFMRGLKK